MTETGRESQTCSVQGATVSAGRERRKRKKARNLFPSFSLLLSALLLHVKSYLPLLIVLLRVCQGNRDWEVNSTWLLRHFNRERERERERERRGGWGFGKGESVMKFMPQIAVWDFALLTGIVRHTCRGQVKDWKFYCPHMAVFIEQKHKHLHLFSCISLLPPTPVKIAPRVVLSSPSPFIYFLNFFFFFAKKLKKLEMFTKENVAVQQNVCNCFIFILLIDSTTPQSVAVHSRLWWTSSTRAWGTWSTWGRAMRNRSQVSDIQRQQHLPANQRVCFEWVSSEHYVIQSVTWWCLSVSRTQRWLSPGRPTSTPSRRSERTRSCLPSPESSVSFKRVQVTSNTCGDKQQTSRGPAGYPCSNVSVVTPGLEKHNEPSPSFWQNVLPGVVWHYGI